MNTTEVSTKRTRKNPVTLSGISAMAEWKIVKDYLDSLNGTRKQGSLKEFRKPQEQLARVEAELETVTDPVRRLDLVQRRMDIKHWIDGGASEDHLQELEDRFVDIASSYSYRKRISYAAWREIGVPARVLKAAGIGIK